MKIFFKDNSEHEAIQAVFKKNSLSVFTSLWRDRDTGRDDMTRWTSSVEMDKNNRAEQTINRL